MSDETGQEPAMMNQPHPGATATLHLHGGLTRTYTVAWVTPCGSRIALDDGTNRSSVHLFAQPGRDADGISGWFWNGFRVTFDNGELT